MCCVISDKFTGEIYSEEVKIWKESKISARKQFLIKITDARKRNSQKQVLLGIIWAIQSFNLMLKHLSVHGGDWSKTCNSVQQCVNDMILPLCNKAAQSEERHSGDMQGCWNGKPVCESCTDCAFWGTEENHPKNVQDKLLAKWWDIFSEAKVRAVVAAHYFGCSAGSCSKRTLLGMLNKEKEKNSLSLRWLQSKLEHSSKECPSLVIKPSRTGRCCYFPSENTKACCLSQWCFSMLLIWVAIFSVQVFA